MSFIRVVLKKLYELQRLVPISLFRQQVSLLLIPGLLISPQKRKVDSVQNLLFSCFLP